MIKIFQYIYTFVIIPIVFFSCEKVKNNELSGHFTIYHYGEENKPTPPFTVKTIKDTTYLRFKQYAMDSIEFSDFTSNFGYRDINIEEVDAAMYSKFKNILLQYNKNNIVESNYKYGTFKIDLMDNSDTLVFTIHRSDYAAYFFVDMEKVAKESGLEKARKRFEVYKNMELKN